MLFRSVMAEADWIVDMGPEAGEGGGEVVAQGTPAQIVKRKKESHTGRVLETFLRDRTAPAIGSASKVAARLTAPAAKASEATAPARDRRAATVAKVAKVTGRAGPEKRARRAATRRKG